MFVDVGLVSFMLKLKFCVRLREILVVVKDTVFRLLDLDEVRGLQFAEEVVVLRGEVQEFLQRGRVGVREAERGGRNNVEIVKSINT